MHDELKAHVADMVLRAQGILPEFTRAGLNDADADVRTRHRANLTRAEHIADAFTPHFSAFGEIVAAAEEQGWDSDEASARILNRAREAHAALTGFDNTKPGA
jgi:hypothetical protein